MMEAWIFLHVMPRTTPIQQAEEPGTCRRSQAKGDNLFIFRQASEN